MVVIAAVVLFDERRASPIALVLLGLWEMHYIYRTCLFPMFMRENGRASRCCSSSSRQCSTP